MYVRELSINNVDINDGLHPFTFLPILRVYFIFTPMCGVQTTCVTMVQGRIQKLSGKSEIVEFVVD